MIYAEFLPRKISYLTLLNRYIAVYTDLVATEDPITSKFLEKCITRAKPPHHISYMFIVRDELYVLMFKIHTKILNFIKFNRIYKSA
jgi:hypothetical protein